MFTTHDFLWSILVPAIITAVITLLSWRPWLLGPINIRWVAPVALAVAFIFAFPQINDEHWYWPLISPRESSQWLPWIAVIAVIGGVLSAIMMQPRWVVTLIVFVLAVNASAMLLKFKLNTHTWSVEVFAMMPLLFGMVTTMWWIAFEQATEEWPMLGALLMGLSCACIALALLLTGSLTYGKFGLIVGFALAGFLPALLWRRDIRLPGLSATVSILLIPLLLGGHFLSKLPQSVLLILFSTPLFIALGILIPLRLTHWKRVVLRLVIAMIPLTTAVIIAAAQFNGESKAGQSDDYSGYYK